MATGETLIGTTNINMQPSSVQPDGERLAGISNKQEHTYYKSLPSCITIKSNKVGTVTALMQDDIQFTIESQWESINSLLQNNQYAQLGEALAQILTNGNVSFVNKNTSRRYWRGSSPIEIPLTLRFEARNDPQAEVIDACLMLQQMAAPTDAKFGFYAPPGPACFGAADLSSNTKTASESLSSIQSGSDRISISIGSKFMLFDNVIISRVGVKLFNQFGVDGKPMSAEVTLVFQTYDIPSKAMLAAIYAHRQYTENQSIAESASKAALGVISSGKKYIQSLAEPEIV